MDHPEKIVTIMHKITRAERKALKECAAQQDADVTALLRAIAREWQEGTLKVQIKDVDIKQRGRAAV